MFPSAPTDGHVHVLCVRALVQNMHRQMDVQMRLYSGSKKSALEREKKTQSVKSIYFVIVASVHQTVNLQGYRANGDLGGIATASHLEQSQRKGEGESLSHRTGRRRDIFHDQSDTRLERKFESVK